MKGIVFAILSLLPTVVVGQIVMPDVIEPYKKIKAGCDCIVPQNGSLQILWKADSATQIEAVQDGLYVFAWAPPGTHWLDAVVITYTSQKVFVPDPQFPEDMSKAKVQVIKVIDPVNGVQRYDRTFVVGTPSPTPPGPNPPGPTPPGPTPPGPVPTDPFAAEAQKWLKAVSPAVYSKEKALFIADNYDAVAAEAVATQADFDVIAFSQKTKEKHLATLGGPAGLTGWTDLFFRPLAVYQDALAKERKIDIYKDEAALARIWRETAAAIRKAAF